MSALVLMYHGIERRPGPLFVEPALFAEHVAAVAESGLPVLTVGELAGRLAQGSLPPLAVSITFDDGFASVVEEAMPALLARGLTATVFCVAGHLGGRNDWATNPRGGPVVPLAPADDLARLARDGIEVGGHGLEHEPLDAASAATIESEVAGGRRALEDAVGAPVRSFAYPYGVLSEPARSAVAASYAAACTTQVGRVLPAADRWSLRRVDAHYLRSPERLARALTGGADAYLAARRLAANARRRVVRDYGRRR
jgi:peptidoglycan/xylan/chitin deacetylase (PgdA/CDA1 family)